MALSRRRFLTLAGATGTLLLGGARLARAQEQAQAIHQATRNTRLGAIGVRLRHLLAEHPARAKAWEGRERAALPEPDRAPALALAEALRRYDPAPGFAAEPVAAGLLARLLHFGYGVTGALPDGVRLRAAPSAGALYAGEVYVVAERVPGLEPGVYAYAPLEERLVVLRRGSAISEVADALETPGRAEGAAAAVLLTNVFRRYRFRYANRGYRYALIDSGHIGENLRLAATSAGLAEWAPLRFHDERLNTLLGVDGIEEAVCAVHLVGAPGPPVATRADRRLVERGASGRPLPAAADDEPEQYHAWTKLVPAEDPGARTRSRRASEEAPKSAPEVDDGTPSGVGPPIELPRRAPPGATVESAIAVRRSARRFLVEPIAAEDLAFVLDAACRHSALVRAPGISLRLFVHRVADVPPGLYRLGPEPNRLVPLRDGSLAEALVDVCLGQEKAGAAAAGIAMVGAVVGSAERRGERAYRDLCLECGAIGQRIYLAAEAAGLAVRNLAAFVDDPMNELTGIDRRREAVLHLTMLGAGD